MSKKVKKEKTPEKRPMKEKKPKVRKAKGRYMITFGKRTIERDEFKVYRVNIKDRRSDG